MPWTLIKISAYFMWTNKLNAAKTFLLPNILFIIVCSLLGSIGVYFLFMVDNLTSSPAGVIFSALLILLFIFMFISTYLYLIYVPMNRWFRLVVHGTEIGEKLLPKFSKEELIRGFLVLLILLVTAILLALPAILVAVLLFLPLGFGVGIPLLILYATFYLWMLCRISLILVSCALGEPISPFVALRASNEHKLSFFLVMVMHLAITLVLGAIFGFIALIPVAGWIVYAVFNFFLMVFSFTLIAALKKLTTGTLQAS